MKSKKRYRQPTAGELSSGVLNSDRVMLGRAITMVESTRPDHQQLAQEVIEQCLPHAGKSIRIAVTGTPGVGKSSLIDTLGSFLVEIGKKVAVLAIDPSSQISKGSILGDKTRMEKLAGFPQAFIRPSPAGESLGGVARKTRETIVLCEAAGFEIILVETVGVGQSEVAVHSMVDVFLLLLLPGAGDELQGIKRGIVEMADILAVNKADGDRLELARQARQSYRNALHLFPPKESLWTPSVHLISALAQTGIRELWEKIETYTRLTRENGFFEKNRRGQAHYWLLETIRSELERSFFHHQGVQELYKKLEGEVLASQKSPFQAAEMLLEKFRSK